MMMRSRTSTVRRETPFVVTQVQVLRLRFVLA